MRWHLSLINWSFLPGLSLDFTGCLESKKVAIRIILKCTTYICTTLSNRFEVRPQSRHTFGEYQYSVDTDLQGSHFWQDFKVWIILIIIWDQSTVNIAHCVLFWYLIKNDLGSMTQLFHDGTLDSCSVVLILLFIVPSIPCMQMAVFTVFDNKNQLFL